MMALEAPWQNGMVERHGGVLGDMLRTGDRGGQVTPPVLSSLVVMNASSLLV